jgi:hypothetical protein
MVDHRLDYIEHLDGGDLTIDRSDAICHLFVHTEEDAEVIFDLELDDDEGVDSDSAVLFSHQMLCDPRNCAELKLKLELELDIEGAGIVTEGHLLGRVAPHDLVFFEFFEFFESQDDIRVMWKFEKFLTIVELQGTF